MMNNGNEEKILTAGVLREKLGDYQIIQELTKGKADDYVFDDLNLLDRDDYVAAKLWCKEDIADELRRRGFKGTDEQVKEVLNKKRILDCLEDADENDWYLIGLACEKAGYKEGKLKKALELWAEFGDVPMNLETECIEDDWHGFPAGTNREEIWHWFEEKFDVSVAEDLMF